MSQTTVVAPNRGDLRSVGKYVIARELGVGGMAIVYLARHPKLNIDVALKVILPARAQDTYFRSKFLEEGEKQAQLKHPHILTVHDSDESDDKLFLVTEYADGGTLRGWLDAGDFDTDDIITCMCKLAKGLAHAHTRPRPVMHLDLKPENVLIVQGEPKLADFGISRILSDQEMVFSSIGFNPGYCAPEQLEGQPGLASDVYALGLMLWEGLLGEKPRKLFVVSDEDREQIAASLPHAPKEVVGLIARCLARTPEERPSATELADALSALTSEAGGVAWRWLALLSLFAGLMAVALALPSTRSWLTDRYLTLLPPESQQIYFLVQPGGARIWIGGDRRSTSTSELSRGAHQVVVTAPSHVGELVEVVVPRIPNEAVRIQLARRPDTVDLEYLAFRNSADDLSSGSYLWRADWQDSALSVVVDLLQRQRAGGEIDAALEGLRTLAAAHDAPASATLFLLAEFGIASAEPGALEYVEETAILGDPLSLVLLATHQRSLAARTTDSREAERQERSAERLLQRAAAQGMPDTAAELLGS